MDYAQLEYYLSRPRLSRFLTVCDHSENKCLELYRVNIRVSQAFYPVLNLFEVIFRNVCNLQLSAVFNNPDWLIAEKVGFMSDPALGRSKYFLRESVLNAEKSISKGKGIVTSEKLVGELSFGFWTSLFDSHHFALIRGAVLRAFPGKPACVNRKVLYLKLIQIWEFRNRVYHNEPVCFNGSTVDFSFAANVRHDIYELLRWIDPKLPEYVSSFDTISENINSSIHFKP